LRFLLLLLLLLERRELLHHRKGPNEGKPAVSIRGSSTALLAVLRLGNCLLPPPTAIATAKRSSFQSSPS